MVHLEVLVSQHLEAEAVHQEAVHQAAVHQAAVHRALGHQAVPHIVHHHQEDQAAPAALKRLPRGELSSRHTPEEQVAEPMKDTRLSPHPAARAATGQQATTRAVFALSQS